jgi:hypothetical protein
MLVGRGELTTPFTLCEKTAQTKLAYFSELYDHTSLQGTARSGAIVPAILQVHESAILL